MMDSYEKIEQLHEQIRIQEGILESIQDQQSKDNNIRQHLKLASENLQRFKKELYQIYRGIFLPDDWTGENVLETSPMVKISFGTEHRGGGVKTFICDTHYDKDDSVIFYVIMPNGTWIPANPFKVASCLQWDECLIVGEAWL